MSIAVETPTSEKTTSARNSRRPGPVVLGCLVFFLLVVLCAIAGSLIAPQDPSAQDLLSSAVGPSGAHWLGTDTLGRDIFSRVLVGARTAMIGPAVAAVGSILFGAVLGICAGYLGGRTEAVIMRGADILHALPAILVAIVVVGALGGGYYLAVGCIVVLGVPSATRMVRSATLAQRNLPYVEAAKTLGLSSRRIMAIHIVPNIMPTIIAGMLLDFVYGLVALSSLSFLGLGVPAGSPDWGRSLADNRALLEVNPPAVVVPALVIVLTATSATVIGDWVYELAGRKGGSRE